MQNIVLQTLIKSLKSKINGTVNCVVAKDLLFSNVNENVSHLRIKRPHSDAALREIRLTDEKKNSIACAERPSHSIPILTSSFDKCKMSGNFQKSGSKQFRQWENTKEHEQYVVNHNGEGTTFTLLSYNILAQNLLESHLYLYDRHDRKALAWTSRFQHLVAEILSLKPEILCVQEMQQSHLNELKNALKPLDMGVIYKKRTGYKDDGCAIFFNTKLFNLVENHTVEYYQPQVQVNRNATPCMI